MDGYKNVHEYIAGRRNEERCTQSGLAELIGVSRTTVQNWEKDVVPARKYWDDLVRDLDMDKNLFLSLVMQSGGEPLEENDSSFPGFLYPDFPWVEERFTFTREEQDFILIRDRFGEIPYGYVSEHGIAGTLLTEQVVNAKLATEAELKYGSVIPEILKGFIIRRMKDDPDTVYAIGEAGPEEQQIVARMLDGSHMAKYLLINALYKWMEHGRDREDKQGRPYIRVVNGQRKDTAEAWTEFLHDYSSSLRKVDVKWSKSLKFPTLFFETEDSGGYNGSLIERVGEKISNSIIQPSYAYNGGEYFYVFKDEDDNYYLTVTGDAVKYHRWYKENFFELTHGCRRGRRKGTYFHRSGGYHVTPA